MTSKPRTIIVIEDNTALGLVLRLNMRRAGFEPVIAKDAEEAWRQLQQQPFDIAIVDHQLPGMSGSQLCAKIRETQQLQALPIIMLTAKKLELQVDFLLHQLGVWKVIAKPFSPLALTRVILECLAERERVDGEEAVALACCETAGG